MAPLEYCYTITRWPEIEWADDCDGADDIGPPGTPLTSLSERIRVKQQSETQVNHFIYSSLSLAISHLPLSLFACFIQVARTVEQEGGKGGGGIDGERITVKRID